MYLNDVHFTNNFVGTNQITEDKESNGNEKYTKLTSLFLLDILSLT